MDHLNEVEGITRFTFRPTYVSSTMVDPLRIAVVAGQSAKSELRLPRTNPPNFIPASRKALRAAIGQYAVAAMFVIAAGIWLPFIGLEIAQEMDWQTTFVGTLLIAASTSVPELIVAISALRMRVVDLAIGGLLGSNLFDVLILAIDDALYTKGPLLAAVSPAHVVTAFAAVIMSGIFIVAVLFRPDTKVRGIISWTSIALLVVYLFSAYASFLIKL